MKNGFINEENNLTTDAVGLTYEEKGFETPAEAAECFGVPMGSADSASAATKFATPDNPVELICLANGSIEAYQPPYDDVVGVETIIITDRPLTVEEIILRGKAAQSKPT